MDGVHPSRCVEWRWCVLLSSCPVQWCGSCPTHPIAVLISAAARVVHCSIASVWCVGGECVSVVFVWWGILCVLPPHVGGGWGRRGWWGGIADGGWHGDGRAAVLLASPSCVWCPPSLRVVVPLNGGSGVLCVVPLSCVVPVLFTTFPVFELDPAPRIVWSPLCCILSCCAVRFFFVLLCCCVAVLWVVEWRWCARVCGLVACLPLSSFLALLLSYFSLCWCSG